MSKNTTFKYRKDKTRSFQRWEMREVVDLIAGNSYCDAIRDYRNCYPLLQRETPEFRRLATERYLKDVPFVCFSAELMRHNGKEIETGYSPLLMLTASNLPTLDASADIRRQASLLPYTRLAFVGATGHEVVVVCELQALGTELKERQDYQALLYRGYGTVRKVYMDHLHAVLSPPTLPPCSEGVG